MIQISDDQFTVKIDSATISHTIETSRSTLQRDITAYVQELANAPIRQLQAEVAYWKERATNNEAAFAELRDGLSKIVEELNREPT